MPAQLQLYFYWIPMPGTDSVVRPGESEQYSVSLAELAVYTAEINKQEGGKKQPKSEQTGFFSKSGVSAHHCMLAPSTDSLHTSRLLLSSFLIYWLLQSISQAQLRRWVPACLPPPPSTSCCTNCHGLLCSWDAHECSDFLVLHNMEEFNYIKANHPRTTLVSFRNSKVELGKVHVKCTYQHSSQVTQHPVRLPALHLPAQTTTEVSAV